MQHAFFLKHLRPFLLIGLLAMGSAFFFDRSIATWARGLPSSLVYCGRLVAALCATMPHLIIWPLLLLLFGVLYKKKRAFDLFLSLTVAVAFSYAICFLLKGVLARAKPGLLFSKNIYGFFVFSSDFFQQAFPSGHTTTISAVCATFAYFFPRYSLHLLLLAVVMGFSRVVTDAHFLSDVVAGLLLGTTTAQWVCVKIQKWRR